jgi:ABC-type phosphate transport system permease subunit
MTNQPIYSNNQTNKGAMDYNEHHKTYALFLGLTKWTVILAIVLLVAMAATLV